MFVSFGVVLATSATGDSFAGFNFVARVARHIAVPFIDNPKLIELNKTVNTLQSYRLLLRPVALRLSPVATPLRFSITATNKTHNSALLS